MRIGLGGTLVLAGLAACAEPAPFQARFNVRGRWPGDRSIAYRIEPESGPLGAESFEEAIRYALESWEATGCVTFDEADAAREPQLVFAWKRGSHGPCVPFGTDPSVAHAGPTQPGTFVHFDSGRDWASGELSLAQAALHEVGHVLGLDHSPDEEAVMFHEPSPSRDRLAASDLAGIHSLYGGGPSRSGDLEVSRGSLHATLHAVAPPELSAWTLFDTDGDGASEVVVWRTDRAGHGALWTYRFSLGAALELTLGPQYGAVAQGLEIEFQRTEKDERLLIMEPERGEPRALLFDDRGWLQLYAGEIPPRSKTFEGIRDSLEGDLDGDGVLETVTLRR